MENQNSISSAAPIIPTAGYIAKPENSKDHEPNKKVIIVVASILLTIVVIIAIVAIIASINQKPANEAPTEEAPVQKAGEPETPNINKKPDAITNDKVQRNLATKANRILTHGDTPNSSMRATNSPVFYTNKKVSDYFNNLETGNKMAIILPRYQFTNNPTLTDEEVAGLSSKSCQALFNEKNCRLIKNNIKASNYQKISQNITNLKQEYRELFGEIEELPNQLINFCPYYTYVEEFNSYVYRNRCGKSDYSYKYSYIYDFRTEGDKYYVYFTSGSLAVNHSTNERVLLYQDMDESTLLDTIDPKIEFTIDKANYLDFQSYRLVFQKDSSGNFIYQKLEKTKE